MRKIFHLLMVTILISLTSCGEQLHFRVYDRETVKNKPEAPKGNDDTGSTDSGSTDSGSTDGGSSDGGSTDGGSTDSGSTDGGSTDGGSTDSGSTDSGSTDGGSSDGGSTDSGSTDGGSSDGGSSDGGSTDGGSTDSGSTDSGSTDGGSSDGGSTDSGSTDSGSTDGGSTDGGSSDGGSDDDDDDDLIPVWHDLECEEEGDNLESNSEFENKIIENNSIKLKNAKFLGWHIASPGSSNKNVAPVINYSGDQAVGLIKRKRKTFDGWVGVSLGKDFDLPQSAEYVQLSFSLKQINIKRENIDHKPLLLHKFWRYIKRLIALGRVESPVNSKIETVVGGVKNNTIHKEGVSEKNYRMAPVKINQSSLTSRGKLRVWLRGLSGDENKPYIDKVKITPFSGCRKK